jgi:hypothetical protein
MWACSRTSRYESGTLAKLLPKKASHMNGCTTVMTRTNGFRKVFRTSRA